MQSPTLEPAFALAKIQPPRPRTGLIERPALERDLGIALQQHRLTLLLAPAGYGKTAALTRQLRQLPAGCALAWVSADEDDGLQRFLACLTAALEPHDLPWRVAPDALATLALGERGLRDVASELVNALAAAETERGLIVIDDAHRISDPQVFELLQLVLERLPERWGVTIASRVEPPLSLARLRAAGELAEFRQYDLRFDETEVAALVASAGGATVSMTARQLLDRTDGWAAGLRLSLAARAGNAATAARRDPTQRHLFDYLAAEVLDDMPAELRDFLLRCSVLPELTAGRCADVSGMPRARRLLEEVERRGLFVSTLEADQLTLRLHDLFRDFLEDRLLQEQCDELPELLRRAARNEPDLPRAVGYLARAGAWDEAVRVLMQRRPSLLADGGGPSIDRMLALFPAPEFGRQPDLHLLRGLAAFPRFDFEAMVAEFGRAATGYAAAGREDDAAQARASACVALLNTGGVAQALRDLAALRQQPLPDPTLALVGFASAWGAFAAGRIDEVAPAFALMLEALERVPEGSVWDRCFFTSLLAGLPGVNPLLERFAAGALRVGGDAPSQLRVGASHARAWLALAAGRLDEARSWLVRADADCDWLGSPRSVFTENRMTRIFVHALRGEREASHIAAREMIDDIKQASGSGNYRTHVNQALFMHMRACWILGADEAMLRALDAEIAASANSWEWAEAPMNRNFSGALVALLDGRLDDAQRLLRPIAGAGDAGAFFRDTQARMMLADVHQRLGQLDEAARTLAPWFAAAERGDEFGGALFAGQGVLQSLATADWGERLSPRERALLDRLAALLAPAAASAVTTAAATAAGADLRAVVRHAGASGEPSTASSLAFGKLSEREREVLAHIAAGDSNKLIARAFDLSPHTVKRHVANILDKLGLASRGQAAAWHRANS